MCSRAGRGQFLDSGTLTVAAARRGLGYAILVKSACQTLLDTGELEALVLDKPAAPLQLFATYLQRRYLPRKVRALAEHFAQSLLPMGQGLAR
ncbi:hypothetical protein CBF45_07655 [Bordetella sp. J329]|nr:hypothetical protein CBF45_07655 [Bordetella sp. J329]